ncbi:transposase [uncultured Spirosoma sp.]|uniref:REP-associated tyrosine transposase n=1 Tax=uncultured Spirosoma sp. TaxID=278208 RepID=UPI002589459D|nr:transposase [uncultured Spirosoma sp.]
MLTHYTRYLPHMLPPEETYFITFRLHGSLPQDVLDRLLKEKVMLEQQIAEQVAAGNEPEQKVLARHKKQYFARFDKAMDTAMQGNDWLREFAVADIVRSAMHHYDGTGYMLHAYCIMPNHVHMLVTALPDNKPFCTIMKSLKGYTARKANALLSRTGQPFWQPESYDHVVRHAAEFQRITTYILNNPIKAGLAKDWSDWPYSYVAV